MAAHLLHGRNDSRELTSKARQTFLGNFERRADPDRLLPLQERRRRAEHLRKAHFKDMARKSVLARRKNKSERSRRKPGVSKTFS